MMPGVVSVVLYRDWRLRAAWNETLVLMATSFGKFRKSAALCILFPFRYSQVMGSEAYMVD